MSLQRNGVRTDKNAQQLDAHGTYEFPCAAYEIDVNRRQNNIVDLHWHEELEIIYCARGDLNLRIPSKTFKLEQGEIAILNSNVMHYIICSDNTVLQSFVFNPALVCGTLDSSLAKKYILPLIECKSFHCFIYHRKNIHLFKEAFFAIKREPFAYEFIVQKNLCQILLDLYKRFENEIGQDIVYPSKNTDSKRIRTMISYIQENYANPIDVQSICDTVGISKRECLRCFKKTLQISPMQYLMKYRIMKSAELLLDDPLTSIVQVGYACGFESPSYYSQLFKRYYHCTPKEYRTNRLK